MLRNRVMNFWLININCIYYWTWKGSSVQKLYFDYWVIWSSTFVTYQQQIKYSGSKGWEVVRLNKLLHRTRVTNYKAHWAIAPKLLYVTQAFVFLLEFEGQAPEPLQPLGNISPAASVNLLWDCQNDVSSGTLQRKLDQLPHLSHHTLNPQACWCKGGGRSVLVEGGRKSKTALLWKCSLRFSFC